MQIGSGQSALSLAVLKTLGVQNPAAAAGTVRQAAGAGGGALTPGKPVAQDSAAGQRELGVSKTVPRGSFVDLKV